MFNPFIAKKWAVIILTPAISAFMFYIGIYYYGLTGGIAFVFVGMLLTSLLTIMLLKNPFTDIVEGKGVLAFAFSSTGIWRPFVVKTAPPFLFGTVAGKKIKDIFDRKAAFSLTKPTVVSKPLEKITKGPNAGGIRIEISEEDYNNSRNAMYHWPMLIYNEAIGSFIPKQYFMDLERNAFAEHSILFLLKELQDLSYNVKDFGRHVIDQLRPKLKISNSIIFWILLILGLGVAAVFFGPDLLSMISGAAGQAGQTVTEAAGATQGVVTPVG